MQFERPFTLNRGLNHIRVHEPATMLAVSYPKVFPSFVLGRIGNARFKRSSHQRLGSCSIAL